MPAARYDPQTIQQGAPFKRTFTLKNKATAALRTGLTKAEARIKPTAESATVILDLDGYLTVDGTAAQITLLVPQSIVDTLTFTKPAVWDLFATLDGAREKMFHGSVILAPNVTD